MTIAVIQFPGSTCDRDAVNAFTLFLKEKAELVWHLDFTDQFNGVIIPGGFTFGDALRAGAIAARSPALDIVRELASEGTPILGICNGFQILIESELLPGALLPNITTTFLCQWVNLRIESLSSILTGGLKLGQVVRMPIAHGEGRYYCDEDQLKKLDDEKRIVFRYCNEDRQLTLESNPNGSLGNIAGIANEAGNVVGMMPHPERSVYPAVSPYGSTEGLLLLKEFTKSLMVRGG